MQIKGKHFSLVLFIVTYKLVVTCATVDEILKHVELWEVLSFGTAPPL